MTSTPQMLPESQIIEEFRQRRLRQWLAAIPGVGSILLLYFGDHPESALLGLSPDALFWIAGAIVVAYLMFSIWNWRCPSCTGYLGKNMNPAFCAKCGAKLKA